MRSKKVRRQKYWLIAILLLIAALQVAQLERRNPAPGNTLQTDVPLQTHDAIRAAFEQRRSDVQVEGSGVVTRLLPDDVDGSRHQRFIVRLAHGQTVLIAHNIDLAPRIDSLKVGDEVRFFGEYEWNSQGGVIHWTHHDPQGRHVVGWVEHRGRRYQ